MNLIEQNPPFPADCLEKEAACAELSGESVRWQRFLLLHCVTQFARQGLPLMCVQAGLSRAVGGMQKVLIT